MSQTVFEIIENHLKNCGFDGLYNEQNECSCTVESLEPCDHGMLSDCRPGYELPCNCGLGCGSHIGPKPEGSANA